MTDDAGTDPVRVVVIGAGYAGLIATNRLLGSLTDEERPRVRVTVVNPHDHLVERIRLHQLAAGSRDDVTVPLEDVLHPDATVVTGTAQHIDVHARTVVVQTPARRIEVPYDHLVYAVGSRAAATVPGARQHAHLLGDHEGARAARLAIDEGWPQPRIAVIGGGFTGVEAAAELAEQHPDAAVTLYAATTIVPQMRPAARRSITGRLRRLGVTLVEGAPVVEVEPEKVRLADGTSHGFDVCVMATSFSVPELARVSGLPTDASGRLRVDEHLRSEGDPRILGAGDAVVAPAAHAAHLRMGCAVALPMGALAAETLLADLRGTQAPQLSVGLVVQCLSLGRKDGYIQLVRADDTPRNLHVGGRLAARIKEKVCTLVVTAPAEERARPGAYSWPHGPRRAA